MMNVFVYPVLMVIPTKNQVVQKPMNVYHQPPIFVKNPLLGIVPIRLVPMNVFVIRDMIGRESIMVDVSIGMNVPIIPMYVVHPVRINVPIYLGPLIVPVVMVLLVKHPIVSMSMNVKPLHFLVVTNKFGTS
jgi:hypothetical protein